VVTFSVLPSAAASESSTATLPEDTGAAGLGLEQAAAIASVIAAPAALSMRTDIRVFSRKLRATLRLLSDIECRGGSRAAQIGFAAGSAKGDER
jgi:hypothetical protein